MLSVGQASGLIAAVVLIIQHTLPAALAVILVKFIGTRTTAVTWSAVNYAISATIWPLLFGADAVSTRHAQPVADFHSWVSTISAVLLVLSSVVVPLGLHEAIVPGDAVSIEFVYIKDSSQWGEVTMPRPDYKFTRICAGSSEINCPGQFQGVVFTPISTDISEGLKTYPGATINTTIPENFTTMFTSATSDKGNTLSGLFDIQYRRWVVDSWSAYDNGQPYVKGDIRYIENLLIQHNRHHLKEGIIVDTSENPGLGFRNHTIPIGLKHGGTWSEDITWIEPVTQCADTNLSIEFQTEHSTSTGQDRYQFSIVDRGAFAGLDLTTLESPPWADNQSLDLFGRAYKAARMHNVLTAIALNISLPLNSSTITVPKVEVEETSDLSSGILSPFGFDELTLQPIRGLTNPNPRIPAYNFSDVKQSKYLPYHPSGITKLLALNYSAIAEICSGYHRVGGLDHRPNNISNPAVQCGYIISPGTSIPDSPSPSRYSTIKSRRRNVYTCASGVRACIKTVDFRYNGTGSDLSNLEVLRINDKHYLDEGSKPLWAVEHSFHNGTRFDPLWGLIDQRYATTNGFDYLRKKKLWLTISSSLEGNFSNPSGYDALAGAGVINRRLANSYGALDVDRRDYTGKYEYALLDRFRDLAKNEATASQIPSLIMTDGLAGALVGTKTSIATKRISYPASLAGDGTSRGVPRAKVVRYKRAIQYNICYAIPAFLVLGIYVLALCGAALALISSPTIIRTMKRIYIYTSTGRLATSLLREARPDTEESSQKWVMGDGQRLLSFGAIDEPKENYFCMMVADSKQGA